MNKILKPIKEFFAFIHDIIESHYLIGELARRDFKEIYADSVLGLTWAILKPLCMAFVMWFAFTYGLRVGKSTVGMPFICYLFTGNLAWDYFSSALSGSTNVILQYSFLVKKINFKLNILPVVKLISSLYISIIFLFIVALILLINGIYPSWYWLQIVYYFFAMMLFVLGLGLITSSITVFVKDVKHIIAIILQFGFWATPILWNPSMLPEKMQILVKINPMAYIVQGMRNSLALEKPFWQDDPAIIVYFWILTFVFLILGIIVFKKTRPHFADVI